MREGIRAGEYPLPRIEALNEDDQITGLWPEPDPDGLHVVVTLPRGIPSVWFFFSSGTCLVRLFLCSARSDNPSYIAAKNLHQVMWQNSLEEKLVNVDGCGKLKYLPPSEVKTLQLKALGCNTNTILVREEYLFTTEKLKEYGPDIGGIILTGHPGSGRVYYRMTWVALLTYS